MYRWEVSRKFYQAISGSNSAYGKKNKQEFNLLNICINDKGKVRTKPQITYGYAPTLVAEFHGNLPKVIVTSDR